MIRLFVNPYRDPDPARDAELQTVARLNRENRLIGTVFPVASRPTFGELFARANEVSEPGDVLVFANADIYFDGTLQNASAIGLDQAYALARWEGLPGDLHLFTDADGPRCDSQDAWVVRSPVRQPLIDAATFTPGRRGCDNRLAWEMQRAGYDVRNPSADIRAIHLHRTEVRRYSHDLRDAVPPPYLLVYPHGIGQAPRRIVRL